MFAAAGVVAVVVGPAVDLDRCVVAVADVGQHMLALECIGYLVAHPCCCPGPRCSAWPVNKRVECTDRPEPMEIQDLIRRTVKRGARLGGLCEASF